MRKTRCAVCGHLMIVHIDEKTDKPFPIQLCSGKCVAAAWNTVTTAIKNGVRPKGRHAAQKRNRRNNKKIKKRQVIIMKKKICAVLAITMMLALTGCSVNNKKSRWFYNNRIRTEPKVRRNYVEKRFTMVSYRPMTDADSAETHTFKESSNFGIIEGTVTIIEKRQEE